MKKLALISLSVLAASVILSGCASTLGGKPRVIPPSNLSDPIEHAKHFQAATSYDANNNLFSDLGLVKEKDYSYEYSVKEGSFWRKFDHAWFQCKCSRDYSYGTADSIYKEYQQICKNNGGELEGKMCLEMPKKDRIIFWVAFNPGYQFHAASNATRPHMGMLVIAPGNGATYKDSRWIKETKSWGFMTHAEKAAATKKLLKSGKGSLVCRQVYQGTYPSYKRYDAGYVEDIANNKLKIRIIKRDVSPEYIKADKRQKDANDTTVWLDADDWMLCPKN